MDAEFLLRAVVFGGEALELRGHRRIERMPHAYVRGMRGCTAQRQRADEKPSDHPRAKYIVAGAMAAIHELSARELSARYASRELSPVDAARACLARIEAWEPRINAMYRLSAEAALEQARAADARWRRGQALSALDGVPVTIKENIYTRGDPSPIGTRANEDAPPQAADAPPAARVREAGCVILGKTTMPDYGMLSSGLSSLHGITRNPWRLDRNTSGSSSGAAAAAVAGYAPLHLGTDIGGSVRLPATHCGIFALKPSLGRVPVYPPYMGRVTGPMTRDVADAALLMNCIARPDARDRVPYRDARILCLLELFYLEMLIDPEATNQDELVREIGKQIKTREIMFPFTYGRVLYDKTHSMSLRDDSIEFSEKETQELLSGTPQGVFQIDDLVTGPLGLIRSKCSRYSPPLRYARFHCADIACTSVHMRSFSSSRAILRLRSSSGDELALRSCQ